MAVTRSKHAYLALAGFVAVTLAIGLAGNIFTMPAIPTWYAGLAKPSFNPPNWIFGPIWTTLYVLMAVAAWRVWGKTGLQSREMAVYGVQLVLNLLWSALFFGAQQIGLALAEMALLWVAIVTTLVLFWAKDRPAGLLFVPYLAWVSFAFVLNLAILRLNGA